MNNLRDDFNICMKCGSVGDFKSTDNSIKKLKMIGVMLKYIQLGNAINAEHTMELNVIMEMGYICLN